MKKENLVKAKQIAEESFRQGLVSQSIPKSVRKYTDKLAMKVNELIPIAVVRKAIDDLQGEATWCVSWCADDLAGLYPSNGEEYFKSKGEAENFVEELLLEFGETLEYELKKTKKFIDGEELKRRLLSEVKRV